MTTTTAVDDAPTRPGQARRSRLTEAALVVLGAVAATLFANREQVAGLASTVPGDIGDPVYFAWQLAWVRHAVFTSPGDLWTTNVFQQAPDNLAFTDTVLGYLPLSVFVGDGMAGALALLNLATLFSTAYAFVGAYVLARVLGARIPGAMVAGAGFAFAPWRSTQIIHINVLSTGGIALALALIAYGHGWSLRDAWRPERIRPGWAFGAWAVACWQLTFGFATGIWFAYSLAIAMALLVGGWLVRGRRRLPLQAVPRRLLVADAAGALAFLLTAALLVRPYLRVLAAHPDSARSVAMLDLFSPPWYGLLTAPDTNWYWASRQQEWRTSVTWTPEMLMSPGILLLLLAVGGLLLSSWSWRRRIVVTLTTGVLVVLALGTTFPFKNLTYLPLYEHAPGWSNLRTPGRLMIWVTLGLCLLAAGLVSWVCDALAAEWERHEEVAWYARGRGEQPPGYLWGRGPGPAVLLSAVLVAPTVLVYGEGWNTTPHWEISPPPVALKDLPQPILLLPSAQVVDYYNMLWSTEGWPILANGDSGFDASGQQKLRQDVKGFPDAAGLAAVRERGIRTVVVVRSRTGPDSWEGAGDKPVDGLDLKRTDTGDAVVFDVR